MSSPTSDEQLQKLKLTEKLEFLHGDKVSVMTLRMGTIFRNATFLNKWHYGPLMVYQIELESGDIATISEPCTVIKHVDKALKA